MTLDSASLLAFLVNAAVQTGIIAAGTAVALRWLRTTTADVKCRIAVAGLALCGAVPWMTAWPAARVDGLGIVASPVVISAVADSRVPGFVVSAFVVIVLWKSAMLIRAALVSVGLNRTALPIAEGPIRASLERLDARSRGIRLCRSARVTTPLVCGIASATIVVPDGFPESDSDLIDAVIAHEWAHIRRNDLAITIAIEVLTLPFAAHPAVAALKRAAARHREIACDEMAIERLRMRRTTYASALMRVADTRAVVAGAVTHGAAAHLEGRVRELLEARPARRISFAAQVLICVWLAAAAGMASLSTVAVAAGWGELSGVWALDLDHSQPRGGLPFRSARLRISAASDHVHIAQQRTRRDGIDETLEIRRTTDDAPSDVTLPGGMVMRTRARWEGIRFVTNSWTIDRGWREHLEMIATGNRLLIRAESVTGETPSRFELVFRREW